MQNLLTECDVTCVCDCTPPAQALSTPPGWLRRSRPSPERTQHKSAATEESPIAQGAPDIHGIGNDLRAHDVSQAGLVDSPAVQVLRRVLLVPSTSCRAKKYLSGGRRGAWSESKVSPNS